MDSHRAAVVCGIDEPAELPVRRSRPHVATWQLAFAGLGLVGCGSRDPAPIDDPWVRLEVEFREVFEATPISVAGELRDSAGLPVSGAIVDLGGVTATTGADGQFRMVEVPRVNATLEISHAAFRDEQVPLHLHQPLTVGSLEIPPILMTDAGMTLTLFGGDIQLGRRYLDPDEQAPPTEIPPDHPEALIQASQPLEGTKELFRHARPMVSAADFAAFNLETVVTDTPVTPDPDNRFLFFTLPGSLPALTWAGIDYVSLANNHIYDYFAQGLTDTLAHLAGSGIPNSGAGEDVDEAFRASRHEVGGHAFSMLSLVSIEGIPVRNSTGATTGRSGAADLNDNARITAALAGELAANRLPIATVHTGYEYMERPPDDGYTVARLEYLADAGAKLVVAHHPHVPQGFHWRGDTLIAHSLGNFVFDQDRVETMFGLVSLVGWKDNAITSVRGRGVYIEAYSPRPLTGAAHDAFSRRLADASRPWGTTVVPYNGYAYVGKNAASEFVVTSRTVELEVRVGDNGFGVADLRGLLGPGESVGSVRATGAGVRGRIGTDIMLFGDMEDIDVDDDVMEVSRWHTTGYEKFVSTFRCQHDTYRGAVALCAVRRSTSDTIATIPFRNRIRVLGDKTNLPNKELTLVAYASRDNAGKVEVEVTYHASFEAETPGPEFGGETVASLEPGSADWEQLAVDLRMPPDSPQWPRDLADPYDPALRINNPRSLKVFFHHHAPSTNSGILRIDDVAIVSWLDALDLSAGAAFAVPNARDFVRVEAAPGVQLLVVRIDKLTPTAATR